MQDMYTKQPKSKLPVDYLNLLWWTCPQTLKTIHVWPGHTDSNLVIINMHNLNTDIIFPRIVLTGIPTLTDFHGFLELFFLLIMYVQVHCQHVLMFWHSLTRRRSWWSRSLHGYSKLHCILNLVSMFFCYVFRS